MFFLYFPIFQSFIQTLILSITQLCTVSTNKIFNKFFKCFIFMVEGHRKNIMGTYLNLHTSF